MVVWDTLIRKGITPLASIGLTTIIVGTTFGIYSFMGLCKETREKSELCSKLVQQCMIKAAGQDNILDKIEGRELAKGLGYNDPVLENEQIILNDEGERGRLRIGYIQGGSSRDSVSIPIESMQQYLGRK